VILLLDSHALLWWLTDDPRLSEPAKRSLEDPANDVLVSAASIWELEIKRVVGRLDAPDDMLSTIDESEISTISVTGTDAIAAARLPMHHRDPFDRIVVAQAQRLDAVVVTRDRAFGAYDVKVLTA
jgi:PIN domain nuclease of toxin-antitoxin system